MLNNQDKTTLNTDKIKDRYLSHSYPTINFFSYYMYFSRFIAALTRCIPLPAPWIEGLLSEVSLCFLLILNFKICR